MALQGDWRLGQLTSNLRCPCSNFSVMHAFAAPLVSRTRIWPSLFVGNGVRMSVGVCKMRERATDGVGDWKGSWRSKNPPHSSFITWASTRAAVESMESVQIDLLRRVRSVLEEEIPKDKRAEAPSYIGVKTVKGRFEVELEKDRIAHKLVFSCREEAAKAYDKAAFKLSGSLAKTNFDLSEEEKVEVEGMEWEDLVLQLQLRGLTESSASGLGYPGVQYKEDEQSWQVRIRHGSQVLVGLYPTLDEASKAYDLAAYKLHGTDTLLSQPLSSHEKKELMALDWVSLVSKLGLRVQAQRTRRKTGCHGVHLQASGAWHTSFTHKNYYFYLGTFKDKDSAARAHDLFAFKLIGEKAKLNTELLPNDLEFLSTHSVGSLREYLANQALLVPKPVNLGARGARLVQGQWEVCLENSRKDRMYTTSVPSEEEALKVHDIAVFKLHRGMASTYTELSITERQEVEAADWKEVASKLDLHQMPMYHGVTRLISGMWQSYIRHAGAYLCVGTFDSAEVAARASDMCAYKLLGKNAILNFPLTELRRQEVEATDWSKLILSIREDQMKSAVEKELGGIEEINFPDVPKDKKWMLLLCHEQLLQQRMMRRAPKVGRQLVVGNPSIAAQFSHLNRHADGSPMLVEEVMDGSNTPLLWKCQCGATFLKAPVNLLKAKMATCKTPLCTVPSKPRKRGKPQKEKALK